MKTQPLSNRTVKRAFGSAIVAVLLVSAISYRGVVVSNESGHWVRHTQEVLENLRSVLAEMQRAESSYRGYVLPEMKIPCRTFTTPSLAWSRPKSTLAI